MNRPKYTKQIFLQIFLIITVCCIPIKIQPAVNAKNQPSDIGRDNPFAKITRTIRPTEPAGLDASELVEEQPELFVQTITLKFLNANSLREALENMCSEYGTITINEETNSLIVCDTKENLERIIAKINKVDKTPQQTTFVETVSLKFLDAENIIKALENMSSVHGSIVANKNTNSLIIRDTRENLDMILSEIKKADTIPKQIMVEVVIIDVQLSDDTEIGVNWDILSDKNYDIGYRQNFTNRLDAVPDTPGDISSFNTTGTGGDFSVISGTIRHVLAMLQQKRNIEILASPRVMVVSGKTASIEAVRELPYNEITNTSEGGQLSSTQFKKVGVKLNVTATLTEDNLILLSVNSEQNVTVGESITQVPIIDTRNTTSELLLKDGQVVIIGGLRRKETTKETNQIPILGDIPLIGFLFKYIHSVINNTELIVFLSPHIYKEGEPIPEEMMDKYKEIKDRPMLSISKDVKMKEYCNQLEQQFQKQTDALEQLQEKIKECERAESELKKYRARLEKRNNEQKGSNKQLIQYIVESKHAENELGEYKNRLEEHFREQTKEHIIVNKMLQAQIIDDNKTENELKEYQNQLKQYIEKTNDDEHLQKKINSHEEAEREAANKMLLVRLRIIQNSKSEDATEELLSTLSSLDKILSQELEESLNSSERVLSKGMM